VYKEYEVRIVEIGWCSKLVEVNFYENYRKQKKSEGIYRSKIVEER